MVMDIQDIRRRNLMRWLETNSTPRDEKSLFSQLKGGGSFGERVARRLEQDYGMGTGYLDRDDEANSSNKGQNTPLSGQARKLVEWVERIDGLGDPARKIFTQMASILQVAETLSAPQNQSAGKLSPETAVKIEEAEAALDGMTRTDRRGTSSHAARKRTGK